MASISTEKKRKRGATKHCAHGTCNNDSRYADRPGMEGIFFIRFPKPRKEFEKCVRWAKACSRVGFDEGYVKKDTYICSAHFVGGKGPTDSHPDPIPANAIRYEVERLKRQPRRKVQRQLTMSPIENKMPTTTTTTISDESHEFPADPKTKEEEIAKILLLLGQETSKAKENSNVGVFLDHVDMQSYHENSDQIQDEILFTRPVCDKSSQTEISSTREVNLSIQNKILENENLDLKSKLDLAQTARNETSGDAKIQQTVSVRCDFDISEVENDDKKCKYFTGLTYIQLLQLWNFLTPSLEHLKYWNRASTKKDKYQISLKNAFLMTLMRLRNGYTNQDLAYRFGTSVSTVSNTILTLIQYMYTEFLPLKTLMFAERSRIKETMPLCFKKYKNIRCIFDCTEFFSQRPSNFQRQGNLYSSYKSHTTYKIVVAISPNGAIMFVSEVFEGSISHREIVVKSGFLNFLNPGDTVMADRGFNIRYLLNAKKVDLIIPPFLLGRKRLTAQEEALTKDLAKHRIHVERSIERIKKIKLLQRIIPLSLEPVMTQIVYIVSCLVNFQEPLVK